jgi:hypothetical protein
MIEIHNSDEGASPENKPIRKRKKLKKKKLKKKLPRSPVSGEKLNERKLHIFLY